MAYNEFVVSVGSGARRLHDQLRKRRIIAGKLLAGEYEGFDDAILICVTEMNTREEIDQLVEAVVSSIEEAG